jgi:outer membrane murein-binding lipoprotein Lpp
MTTGRTARKTQSSAESPASSVNAEVSELKTEVAALREQVQALVEQLNASNQRVSEKNAPGQKPEPLVETLEVFESAVSDKLKEVAEAADIDPSKVDQVKREISQHPFMATAAGVLLGVLISRIFCHKEHA